MAFCQLHLATWSTMKHPSRRHVLGILTGLTLLSLGSDIVRADADDSGDNDTGGEGGSAECAHESAETFHSNHGTQPKQDDIKSLTQNEALWAVKNGRAVSLPDLLSYITKKYHGDVLDVRLRRRQEHFFYLVKYLENSTNLHMIELEAKTLKSLETPCAY